MQNNRHYRRMFNQFFLASIWLNCSQSYAELALAQIQVYRFHVKLDSLLTICKPGALGIKPSVLQINASLFQVKPGTLNTVRITFVREKFKRL